MVSNVMAFIGYRCYVFYINYNSGKGTTNLCVCVGIRFNKIPVSRLLTDIEIISQKYIFSGAARLVPFSGLSNCLLREVLYLGTTAGILANFLLQKYQIYEFITRCCSVVRWEKMIVFLKQENGSTNIQYNFYKSLSLVLFIS